MNLPKLAQDSLMAFAPLNQLNTHIYVKFFHHLHYSLGKP